MGERAKRRRSLWDDKEEHPFLVQTRQKDAWPREESHYNFHGTCDSKLSVSEVTNALKSEGFPSQQAWELLQENNDGLGFPDPGSPKSSWGKSLRYTRGRSRSRSQSQERSVSKGSFMDHRRGSYRWDDRRNIGMEVSPRPCGDFAAGRCRSGKQCRFLHQENFNHRNGVQLDKDQTERWKNREEYGGNGNYYNGERDGNRGSSCRYPHADTSGDDCERSNRNMLSNKDIEPMLRKSGNTPCRYFMMGKCRTDECKFSHTCLPNGILEGRLWFDGWGHGFDDMNKSWNGPKWGKDTAVSVTAPSSGQGNVRKVALVDQIIDEKQTDNRFNLDDKNKLWNTTKQNDATGVSVIEKSTGLSYLENVNLIDPRNVEKIITSRQGQGLDEKSRMQECSAWKDDSDREEVMSPDWVSGIHLVGMGISGSKDVPQSFSQKQTSLIPQGLQRHTLVGISKDVPEQNIMQEPSCQQHLSKIVDNIVITDDFNSVNGVVDIKGNPRHPVLVPGKLFKENAVGFSSQPQNYGGINLSQQMIFITPSNQHNINPRGPVQSNSSFIMQNERQVHHQDSVCTLVNSGNPCNVVNSEQVMQITTLSTSLTETSGNGQLHQLYAAANPPVRTPIGLTDACPPGFSSNCIEQKNQIPLEEFSPSSTVLPEPSKLPGSGHLEDDSLRYPELKQSKPIENSVAKEDRKPMAEKGKSEQDNDAVGNPDSGKDDKALRLFKNALIDFVKELLKPKWKEGQMSREVHKSIVKKVVAKVTNSVQGDSIPKTQNKVDQYLSFSKSKLTKLVEAYMEKLLKSP